MYIDAGSGSMLLQAAAAIVFGMLVFSRQIFGWIKRKIFRKEDPGREQ